MPVRRYWPRTDRWLLYANLVVYGTTLALVAAFHGELGWAVKALDGYLRTEAFPPTADRLLVGEAMRYATAHEGDFDGVAALLELSRMFIEVEPEISVRFVAFVNEEPPFFYWNNMGSMVYAKAAKERGDRIRGMVSIETVGYYSEEPGSQRYPPLFRLFFPDRGNFIGFVSNFRSRSWLKQTVEAFKTHSDIPTQHVAMFEAVPGIGWSDHLSFWRQGWPALMITDTAPYRYPYYHTAEDTPDKVDYETLTRLTKGLFGTFVTLAGSDRST